jgi:hypothetical protein
LNRLDTDELQAHHQAGKMKPVHLRRVTRINYLEN